MAATDKTYHNQRTLDIIFAVSCILMLVCTIWMLVADYNREFKTVQRNFRDVESVLDERQMIGQLPDPDEVKERQKAVVEKRLALKDAKKKVEPEQQRLTAERDQRTDAYQSIKADFDSKTSFYNIEISELNQVGLPQSVRRERTERLAARKQEIDELQKQLDKAQRDVDKTGEDYKKNVTDPVSTAENELSDAEDAEKKLTVNFDRFAKLTVQKQWGYNDVFRALPILDAFESPTKIRQIVLGDLPIEYGSFKYVTRYDRCTSCHLAIERGAFDHSMLTKLTRTEKETGAEWRRAALTTNNDLAALVAAMSEDDQKTPRANLQAVKTALDKADRNDYQSTDDDPNEVAAKLNDVLRSLRAGEVPGAKTYGSLDREVAQVQQLGDQLQEARLLPKKMRTAREILQNRKDKGEALGFDPSELPTRPRTVSLTEGQITQYAAHPRLDLFVDSNSAHPMEKFGCTVCHGGQGSATDFLLSAHTPANAAQHKQWEDEYHWHSSADWEFPMLSNRFVESSCVKCHHEVTDLVRQGAKEEAPKLLRGFNLVRENGCFGCHEIGGIKKGQEVGPDLRLEPSPALAWLSPTDQEKAKADPLNPPGTYRKVGPSLRRIAEKTNEEWARRWIQSPRGFRPDTKMPHFYNLSTNNPDVLPDDQRDFPGAEIHSIAHYLFAESAGNLEGKDSYRLGLQQRLKDLQAKLAKENLDDKDRKVLYDVTHRLSDLALLSIPAHSTQIDGVTSKLRQAQDSALELYEKIRLMDERIKDDQKRPEDKRAAADLDQATQDHDAAKKELDNVKKELEPLGAELEKIGQIIPIEKQIVDEQGETVTAALPETDAKHLTEGRRLFSERGCLACHVHDGVRQKGADGSPAVSEEAASFAPDLSRIAAKIAPQKGDAKARRRWVVQWVLNPNIYHPRTRMPITHLTVQQACDVADWLLSQEVNPKTIPNWPADPEQPRPETLVKLARLYLAKAPGMTAAKVNEVLAADAGDLDNLHGYSAEDLKYATYDADERILQGKITSDKLEWYIGRKSISRLGCYGCHDLPGFETAKPIGTALNDWGAKDPERLAFEDADVYVRQHHNIVDARDAVNNPHQAASDWHSLDGKPPYESVFYNALEHHEREGFLNQKLNEPRSYDYNRIRAWDDRLRMPQFRFARSRRRANEVDEAYEDRMEREEGEAREAVMTFILGLVAEPIPLKYEGAPTADRLAEAKGRQVLEKYNCVGCHQVEPGVYDFKPTKDTIDALERVYQSYASNQAKKDHVFPGHNAWTGVASPWPDRLSAHGTQPRVEEDETTNRDLLNIRLTEALRFTNNDKIVRDIPAGMTAKLAPEDVTYQAPTYGGAFAELLIPYLAQTNSTLFGGKPDEARSVLPPPLVREGERVQPKWLYQFLLDPGVVRPPEKMKLRMPKFNMSDEDAMTLVNYFGAVAKQSNPGAGVTYPYLKIDQIDAKYWHDRTQQYQERLKAVGGADGKGLDQRAKDLLGDMKKGVQLHLDAVKAAAGTAMGEDKTRKEAEVKELQATIEKWDKQIKDGNVADIAKEWQSPEAYAADAYRLVAANPNICTKCHSIGALKIENANGPDLSIAFERLRPEWTFQWISNPDRMFAYSPTMPQNFPKDSVDYKEYFAGDPRDRARAARDVLMDLPRLDNLPADRATRAAVTGEK